jgi:HKD family nuclease
MEQKPGLYESIVTHGLSQSLPDDAFIRPLRASEASRRLSDHLRDYLQRALSSVPAKEQPSAQIAMVNELLEVVDRHTKGFPASEDAVRAELLQSIGAPRPRPQLPLSESGLYVNANRERSLQQALKLEAASADRIDLICAFLFWQGYRHLKPVLTEHLERGGSLRVLTTTYCGVTQAKVLDELQAMGAQVRVSYESGATRLHAKAWIFHRNSRFGTALVGSSNLSHSALTSGKEWNVRLSQVENRPVFGELAAAFENHWQDEEFLPYERDFFLATLRAERPKGELRSVFKLRPRTFQRVILERLTAERELQDQHRNLVVAATGTGKTVVAALDYAGLNARAGKRLRLLFVAHRKEILAQSRDTFRHAVSDGSFGELFVDGEQPLDWDHVFASVQSLQHKDLAEIDSTRFDVIIIDEFHHAAAPTYTRLLSHFQPQELLGLTATPERADGQSILRFFDGRVASELRIWDAIDRGLLVPFQYWGVHDTVDLKTSWRGGKYSPKELEGLYTGNHARAHLVVQALGEYFRHIRPCSWVAPLYN